MKHFTLLIALVGVLSACGKESAKSDTYAASNANARDTATMPTPTPTKTTPLTDPDANRVPATVPPKPVDPRDIDTRSTDPVGTDAVVIGDQAKKDADKAKADKAKKDAAKSDAGASDSLTQPGLPPQNNDSAAPPSATTPAAGLAGAKATTPSTDTKPAPQDAAKTKLGTMDTEFISKAAVGGLFEVDSSELAVTQATTPFVRDFAQMMVMDHGDSGRELGELARGKGATVPQELDAEHQTRLETLRTQKGVDFDRQYRDMQVTAHKDAIALFERAATECEDADLKAFAEKMLPTLRDHQKKLSEMPPTEGV